MKILVLCTGNICRSPAAEAMLKARTSDEVRIEITSAGVAAPIGRSAHRQMISVCEKLGISISPDHRSRQVQRSDLSEANAIIVMELGHKHWVRSALPDAANKTFLLGQWRGIEIPDPIGQSDDVFVSVANLVRLCCADWAPKLSDLGNFK